MKLFIHRYAAVLKTIIVFGVIAIFVYAEPLYAQSRTTANKINTQRPKRVFYGQASYYSNSFNGKRTANGEIFSQKKFTCACNVLPLGTWIKVTNLRNGRSVIVKTNDRIHPRMKRVVDLSKAAAHQLGFVSRGLTRVKVELLDKRDTR